MHLSSDPKNMIRIAREAGPDTTVEMLNQGDRVRSLRLFTKFYEPADQRRGDSTCCDASMGHDLVGRGCNDPVGDVVGLADFRSKLTAVNFWYSFYISTLCAYFSEPH
jgi:hypothetical protein